MTLIFSIIILAVIGGIGAASLFDALSPIIRYHKNRSSCSAHFTLFSNLERN